MVRGVLKLASSDPLSARLVNLGSLGKLGMPNCAENCSGHGECHNGTCLCEIQFQGDECHIPNVSYFVAFATAFFILALVCLIQLVMCVVAEWQRMKAPSLLRACRITVQKVLYFVVFLATIIRGAYFTSPAAFREGWSSSLLSAYYPLLLTGASLIVCFWAEVFHLKDIRWEKTQFLSKSYLAFVTFNIITYSLLLAEFVATQVKDTNVAEKSFYSHIFNGCYAFLLFVVVIFFLIYGIEVFFKVRGGFLYEHQTRVTSIAAKRRSRRSSQENGQNEDEDESAVPSTAELVDKPRIENNFPMLTNVDTSQLHQSRFGLLSQAFMLFIIVGFLFSETLGEFWKEKVPLTSRNWHDLVFRVVEIGVALWFPCVLWNCMSPERLWILNPKRILKKYDLKIGSDAREDVADQFAEADETTSLSRDCWICYDSARTDAGPLIQPCQCRGDVSSVHHDCLRRWLVESSGNPNSMRCKVCGIAYQVERSSRLDWQHGFTTQQVVTTASLVTIMCVSAAIAWVVIQLFQDSYIRMMAAGMALIVSYLCVRFLSQHTLIAYQRAKVSAFNIMGSGQLSTISQTVLAGDTPDSTTI